MRHISICTHTVKHIQSNAYSQTHTAKHIQTNAYSQTHTAKHIQSNTYSQTHTVKRMQYLRTLTCSYTRMYSMYCYIWLLHDKVLRLWLVYGTHTSTDTKCPRSPCLRAKQITLEASTKHLSNGIDNNWKYSFLKKKRNAHRNTSISYSPCTNLMQSTVPVRTCVCTYTHTKRSRQARSSQKTNRVHTISGYNQQYCKKLCVGCAPRSGALPWPYLKCRFAIQGTHETIYCMYPPIPTNYYRFHSTLGAKLKKGISDHFWGHIESRKQYE